MIHSHKYILSLQRVKIKDKDLHNNDYFVKDLRSCLKTCFVWGTCGRLWGLMLVTLKSSALQPKECSQCCARRLRPGAALSGRREGRQPISPPLSSGRRTARGGAVSAAPFTQKENYLLLDCRIKRFQELDNSYFSETLFSRLDCEANSIVRDAWRNVFD